MKIKITETKEIEKATPFFTKNNMGAHYAFYSETSRITVHDYPDYPLISINTASDSCALLQHITAKEFEDSYVRVSERLNDLFEQGRDKVRESKSIDTLINELNKD